MSVVLVVTWKKALVPYPTISEQEQQLTEMEVVVLSVTNGENEEDSVNDGWRNVVSYTAHGRNL
jgi:hypothetical protein